MAKLTEQEAAHARSISDTNIIVAPVPPLHKPRVLIGSVIRKPASVIAAWLRTLEWQLLRRPTEVGYYFITDFPAGDPQAPPVRQLLTDFSKKHKNVTIRHAGGATQPPDFAESDTGHHWSATAWHRVGALKNEILQGCLDNRWDSVWLVDADVLCEPYTLQSLMDTECPIVAGVYWTHWQRVPAGSTAVVHAGPQVWLRHPYELSGHGYTEPDFRGALISRKLIRVWGLGACTLLHRSVLEKGVSFTPVPEGLPPGPMSDGEDRHLCERARRLHIPLYADPWPDIWHAYHAADYGQIPAWLGRFASPRPAKPDAATAVSFKLELLEPVPSPGNPQMLQYIAPQYVRGRLAQLPVLPEIAEALAGMTVGERRIVRVHFPLHYPYATLRLQTRMLALTLLDCKAANLPPVIGEELFAGQASWKTIDATSLTAEQVDSVLEEAHAVAAN